MMAQHSSEKDVIEEIVGNFGRWQLIICLTVSLLKISVAWNQLAIVFLAPPIPYWCAGDRNATCPEKCERWEYDHSIFQSTIITEWDLVCSRAHYASATQTIFMLGILLGNLLFGYVSDRFGRKMPLLVASFLQVVFGVGSSLANNFFVYLLLRLGDAIATGGSMVTSFVICMEVVGAKWRTVVGVLYHLPFAFGHLTLSGMSYLFRDWRSFQIAISLPNLLMLLSYWLVPESPRWLLTKGRKDKAEKILNKAVKRNKREVKNIAVALESWKVCENGSSGNLLILFRNRKLLPRTFAVCLNWMTCGLCLFGISQYMGQIEGNIFLNFCLGGVTEIPGTILCIYFMEKFGRRKTLLFSQILSGVSCILITVVPSGWPVVFLSTISVIGMSIAFPSVYLFSGELYPTVVRNVAVGFGSMWARVGSMAAPFISGLNDVTPVLPPLIFGIFPLIAALLCFILPETKNIRLKDTIDDI